MLKYTLYRVLLMTVTFVGISMVGFALVNLAPGGPVEQLIQQMRFGDGGGGSFGASTDAVNDNNQQGVSQEVIEAMTKHYGLDKPLWQRYVLWMSSLLRLDFGESFLYEEPVIQVIVSKFPVSLQFGIFSFILVYLLCIPLGVMKAVRDGTAFDFSTSFILYVAYSIPSIVLGIVLLTLLSGGQFLDWFPVGGFVSQHYSDLTFFEKILDKAHHAVLPLGLLHDWKLHCTHTIDQKLHARSYQV